MFDKFFFFLGKTVYALGPDWMILSLFMLTMLVCILVWLSLKVPRIMSACMLFIILAFMTYFPLAAFPSVLVQSYLYMGLITPWYIQSSPEILHFPTLWLFTLGCIVGFTFVSMVLKDIVQGQPLSATKITEKKYEEALATTQRIIDESYK